MTISKVIDISGMDAKRKRYGYEWGCQIIAARGLRWLREHTIERELPKHIEFANITGISIPENEAAKQMEAYILDHPKLQEFGVTGAMMQYGMAHARYRFLHSEEEYLKCAADTPRRIFEFDDDDAFPTKHEAK